NSDGTSRFPKLDECAHFHYDNVELGPISVVLSEGDDRVDGKSSCASEWWFCVQVTSNGKSWQVRRSLDNFQMLDHQLHRCVYDRKFSLLKEINVQSQQQEDALRTMLTQYLERFSQLAGSLINCGPVLNWLELDNRGNRLIVTDEAAINTPAVAAAYVIKRYASQASDEISLEVGDIISVIDMPPPEESSWWRGKKGFQVSDQMSNHEHMGDRMRWRIVSGQEQANHKRRLLRRCCLQFQDAVSISRRSERSRSKSTTVNENRYLLRSPCILPL
ncbi:rho GTPase-activating protein 33-like, partial [Stegodyphus dumicola]|uniref:rho GTPase-activating protein 33-like n=1 Tax=Stegodyphus dumicola TaxID=202533 RepID=UPI0015AF1B7E